MSRDYCIFQQQGIRVKLEQHIVEYACQSYSGSFVTPVAMLASAIELGHDATLQERVGDFASQSC